MFLNGFTSQIVNENHSKFDTCVSNAQRNENQESKFKFPPWSFLVEEYFLSNRVVYQLRNVFLTGNQNHIIFLRFKAYTY